MTEHTISKSQYVKGKQCELALWYYRNRKDLRLLPDESAKARFATGYEVEALAKSCFRNFVEVTEKSYDIANAEKSTKKFIKAGHKTICEATAINPYNGAYSRIDVLKKVRGKNEWDLIEVKGIHVKTAFRVCLLVILLIIYECKRKVAEWRRDWL